MRPCEHKSCEHKPYEQKLCEHKSCEHKPYEQKLCGKIKENRLETGLFFYALVNFAVSKFLLRQILFV